MELEHSFRFHNSPRVSDRQHNAEAYARDFRHYTWTDVTEAPAAMLRELARPAPSSVAPMLGEARRDVSTFASDPQVA